MTLEYSTVVQVKITMLEYIDEILDAFDKLDPTGGGTKSSATPAIILKVYVDCRKFNTTQAVEFHHLAAKILFAIERYGGSSLS